MSLKTDANPKKVLVALVRAIYATFDETKWGELALLTDSEHLVYEHSRLFRSMYFGDDDHFFCVQEVICKIADVDIENLRIMEDYVGLYDWLKIEDPNLHAEIYDDKGVVALGDVEAVSLQMGIEEVNRHAARIRKSIGDDPEQAIGSAKELLESVLKGILEITEASASHDISALLKEAQRKLDLEPQKDAEGHRRDKTTKRTLSNLGQVVIGVNEVRNFFGTGHGRFQSREIKLAHARLTVNAAVSVATFLVEVASNENRGHRDRRGTKREDAKQWQQRPLTC